jgi:hypothetical protein
VISLRVTRDVGDTLQSKIALEGIAGLRAIQAMRLNAMADLSEIVRKERQNMIDASQKRGRWYLEPRENAAAETRSRLVTSPALAR